jgi:hypothetical protein
MGLLDSIKRWFSGHPEEVDELPAPGSERAGETLKQERGERQEDPRPSIASEEGDRTSEPDREA